MKTVAVIFFFLIADALDYCSDSFQSADTSTTCLVNCNTPPVTTQNHLWAHVFIFQGKQDAADHREGICFLYSE